MSHQSAHKASSNFKIADADSPVKYESDVSIKRIAHEIADVDPKPKQEFMSYEELKKMSFEKLLNMQSSVAKKVENVGILLVVSPHEDSDVYYRKIYNQARMIRELEPDINICLLAPNMDKHQSAILGSVINRFKQIPNSGSFSLMHAMKLSPYAITLFIRSDIVLCMPFISDILPFFEEKQLDIVYSGNSHDTCPLTVEDSDFGAVMYRPFNEKFLKISDLWIKNVPKVGDQSAYLKRFLYNHRYELKIGRFSPSFGGSLRPVPEIEMVGGKNYTHYQSRIISGQVKFFKMQSDSPKFSSELCDFLNSYTLPRSLIWNKKKNPSLVHGALKDSLEFFVTEEDCELAVEGKCDNIPWDLPEAIEVVDLPKRARGTKIGVVYSILETDLEKYQSKMKEIVNSVSSVRNVESEVSITFISHDFFPDCLSKESHNFDNIILKRIDQRNPFTSQLQIMTDSPYEYSIFMNSDTFACSAFLKEFLELLETENIDISLGSNVSKDVLNFENGISTYRKNVKVSERLDDFMKELNNLSSQGPLNVTYQNQLMKNFFSESGLEVKAISPRFGFRIHEGGANLLKSTIPFNGKVNLIHGCDKVDRQNLCLKFNERMDTRVIVTSCDPSEIMIKS